MLFSIFSNNVIYYFRIPTSANTKLIKNINIVFPLKYQVNDNIRFVGTEGIAANAPSAVVTGQTIILQGVTPYDGVSNIGFKIEGISNPTISDSYINFIANGEIHKGESNFFSLIGRWKTCRLRCDSTLFSGEESGWSQQACAND